MLSGFAAEALPVAGLQQDAVSAEIGFSVFMA